MIIKHYVIFKQRSVLQFWRGGVLSSHCQPASASCCQAMSESLITCCKRAARNLIFNRSKEMQAFLLLQSVFTLTVNFHNWCLTFPLLVKNSQLANRLPCSPVCTWKLCVSHNLTIAPLQIKLYRMSVMCAKTRIEIQICKHLKHIP